MTNAPADSAFVDGPATQGSGYAYLNWQLIILEGNARSAAYALLTVALFTFNEFCTSVLWAKVSDCLGRKLTLIIGAIGGSFSALLFGLSTNVWVALGARLFGGLVNPNVGVISACVGELVKKKEHQGRGFSVVPFLRGLGSLIGPVIGGHLANPVATMPLLFRKNTIWETFPYLLPNLVVVGFIMTSGLLGILFLEESHPRFCDQHDSGRSLSKWVTSRFKRAGNRASIEEYAALNTDEDAIPLVGRSGTSIDDDTGNTDEHQTGNDAFADVPKSSAYSRSVILQILAVSLLAFHKVSSDAIIPIFLASQSTENSPSSNPFKFSIGFGFKSPQIANVLLTQAIVAIISQALVVPKVIDHFGPLRTFRWTLFMLPWIYILTPFTARLPYPISLMAILLDLWTKGVLVNLGYVCSAILLTNVISEQQHLATVNEAAASIGCLARSIGADEAIKPPSVYGNFHLDEAVLAKLPISGTKVISSHAYGMSLWGRCAKIVAELPDGQKKKYFLKVSTEKMAKVMCEGEFEGMKALNAVLPTIAPYVYAWGKYQHEDAYFMIADFREVGEQPPNRFQFTARLAELHKKSLSPTGKFDLHTTTCHGTITQATDLWEESWAELYKKQLEHMFDMDLETHGHWPEFEQVVDITLNKVIPRLLNPLQSEGRSIKPCLLHGDCWDENTATNMENGEPFIFDAGSFYGHNEYDVGNWRAPRHRLSSGVYMKNYQRNFEVSAPEEDWDGRNLLYSLRFDIGTAILIPGCKQREVVFENMKELIKTYCKEDWTALEDNTKGGDKDLLLGRKNRGLPNDVEDEEEEEEEEE
ncbi:hypothetical protein VTL71DRAFT_14887 [Oculimacula yallundae]|uniref:protein-ribulosamine 3-kinase n=1 Tax=Oculimacula yallundae TaxID=86028 RepID=A0ABR4CF23_9HELO